MHGVARIGGKNSINLRALELLPCLPLRITPPRLSLHRNFQNASASSRTRHVNLPRFSRDTFRSVSALASMELNGHLRPKRKGSPNTTHDRPKKLFKPESSEMLDMNGSPNDSQFMYDSESIVDGTVEPVTATADTAEWQATIEAVVKNVVSIHFCQTCSFDTSSALASEATGFVVDAAKGYILTNRHVVGSGPFWGYCIFDNHEEVNWKPFRSRLESRLMRVCSVTSTLFTATLSTILVSYASTQTR